MKLLAKTKDLILDILFPPICIGCKNYLLESEKSEKICMKCFNSIKIYSSFFCPECKNRVTEQKIVCHKKINFLLAPITNYQNIAVKNIIKFLKYKKWVSLKNIIKPLIHSYLDILGQDLKDFTVIPIPLHKDRYSERGFNQSKLIAEIVSEKININLNTNNLIRTRATKNQAELKNIQERLENIQNCFALKNAEEIKNKNIIIVDDVFTSGSTVGEAVKILKAAGAKKIIALVLARA